jgi:ArsR family transcriptional regulator, arsenate/arsenite/antimonite-responsive transcriptional repressor
MKNIEEQAVIFNALADPMRLKILQLLSRQQNPNALCVNALTCMLDITQPAVSQHLKILKSAGLVEGQKRGNHVHYSVNAKNLKYCQDLIATLLKPYGKNAKDPCQECPKDDK